MTAHKLAAALIGLCPLLLFCGEAVAQRASGPLSTADQRCVISNNKLGVKLFAAQGKAGQSCVKMAGKAALEDSFDDCVAPVDGTKFASLADKLAKAQSNKCGLPLPIYGYAPADDISAAALDAAGALSEAVFGSPVEAALVSRDEDFDSVKCQLAVVRACFNYASARMKEFKNCKKTGLKDGSILDATTMADCVVADPRNKVASALERIVDSVESRCPDTTKLDALFPGSCAGSGATGAELGQCIAARVDCETCVLANELDDLLYDCDTLDDGAANGSCRACGNGILEAGEQCDDAGQTPECDIDCTLPACGDGVFNPGNGEECDDGNGVDGDGCDLGCKLSGCGNGVIGGEEQCDDGNVEAGDGCDSECLCEPGAFLSGCQDPQCPDVGVFLQMAAVGGACSANADCPAGTCDDELQRCLTPTTDDLGSSGIVHNVDSNEASDTRLRLTCPGPGPTCGTCLIDGIDPAPRNCRCANDNRATCDEPLRPDADHCGGAICECFEGPPSPNSAGNTPVCTLWKHVEDVSGTVDVDTGQGVVSKAMRAIVHLGEHLVDPCPRCENDDVARDGIPEGTCSGGPNDGQPCDVDAFHTSFPAPGGGGGHSLDCMPSPAKNISALGVEIRADLTTGTSVLASTVPCGITANPDLCPCGVCSQDPSLACSSDQECAAAGVGTCGRYLDGVPSPNDCVDGLCTDVGGGEGKCLANQVRYCDGVLRADGRGFVSCLSNADCETSDCGEVSCGACTIVDPLDCFLEDVVTVGQADPMRPVRGASYCIPPSTAGVNAVLGLPGPARIVRQEVARYVCAGDGITSYLPGQGGCP